METNNPIGPNKYVSNLKQLRFSLVSQEVLQLMMADCYPVLRNYKGSIIVIIQKRIIYTKLCT